MSLHTNVAHWRGQKYRIPSTQWLTKRRILNRITRIKNEEGVWISDYADLESLATNFFSNNTCKNESDQPVEETVTQLQHLNLPIVNNHQKEQLLLLISDKEVEAALFQIEPYKAPDPDGFPAAFFQCFWPIIKQDELINDGQKFLQ